VATGAAAETNQTTVFTYDKLSRVKTINQSYAIAATGPSTLIERDYEPNSYITREKVFVNGTKVSEFTQSWDGAGRRTNLSSQLAAQGSGLGRVTNFTYRADGLLGATTVGAYNHNSFYDTRGLITSCSSSNYTRYFNSRDARGRMLTSSTRIDGAFVFSESQSWYERGQRMTYGTISTGSGAWNENHTYSYNGD
jgi:hypothetical protein